MSENKTDYQKSAPVSWLFKMAWRDSRKNRSRLLLFTSSIIMGIAALVAVYSFSNNLQHDLDEQAKSLSGADLTVLSRKPISKSTLAILDTLGDERAREQNFISMLYFIKGQGSKLVQVKALEGKYPFYGAIETSPKSGVNGLTTGRNAVVDRTVMLQFGALPGDSVKLGNVNFGISGFLENAPGQTGVVAMVTPIVYLPMKYLAQTGLAQEGSRINYFYYYKFRTAVGLNAALRKLRPILEMEGIEYETVASKKERTGRSFEDLNQFLALSGFVALLLGCIGVGSAIHVYVREKMAAISTLRCLGLKAWDAFLIYLIQITFIGMIGAVIGAVLGTGIQFLLPVILKDILPVAFTMQISWIAILQGILTGILISVLFALPSLLTVRHISPLNAIRLSFEELKSRVEPLKWLVYFMIFLFVTGFTYLQVKGWMQALVFTCSIFIAIGLFYGLSLLLLWGARRLLPANAGYAWRQGFSNLYRPNNQTLMLIVAIGLSTALISTLYFVQGILISRVTLSSGEKQPNLILFDIQNDQKEQLTELTKRYHLPLMGQVPVVTMRIDEINGRTAAQAALADSLDYQHADSLHQDKAAARPEGQASRESSDRAFKGEIRATFENTLTEAEQVTSGKWHGSVKSPSDTVYVSLEERYAERLKVKVGDKIQFNVQGMLIPTVVGSLRKVDWVRVQTNFRLVFPEGVLEEAPQFHVLTTKVPDPKTSAAYQAAVVRGFPNVTIIDVGILLKLLDELLGKISFVIRFMASFSMITGWIVLISAVRSSKNQRLREIVLLRTMGATGRQILAITAIEYLFLGALSAAGGVFIALAGSWALASFIFASVFVPPLLPALILFSAITLLVVITGMLGSRSVLHHPPLEVLRKDS
ncbi:ABC transporter permease [Pedobacter sp. AW31-3R]|uniref:ABC transporter permease n=1 Tax=Pedobacter sp. AW31-3R TaxID=3445781 RepID=UPI003F9FC4C3